MHVASVLALLIIFNRAVQGVCAVKCVEFETNTLAHPQSTPRTRTSWQSCALKWSGLELCLWCHELFSNSHSKLSRAPAKKSNHIQVQGFSKIVACFALMLLYPRLLLTRASPQPQTLGDSISIQIANKRPCRLCCSLARSLGRLLLHPDAWH